MDMDDWLSDRRSLDNTGMTVAGLLVPFCLSLPSIFSLGRVSSLDAGRGGAGSCSALRVGGSGLPSSLSLSPLVYCTKKKT